MNQHSLANDHKALATENAHESAVGNENAPTQDDNAQTTSVGFLDIVISTLAAAFGVQSSRNRQRDFSSQSPLPFIISGIIFTVLFIGTLVVVVNIVLK